MKFTINKLPIGYINGIRRAILSDIKCVAIDDKNVTCIKNDTALHNEFMSHRISLIPCCIDPQHYDELASYVFEINVTNKGTVDLDVTSKDITVRIHDRVASAEERDAIFPPCKLTKDYILITVLHPSQTFHATFSPSVGTAKEHVRWCPVSTCTFYNSIASSDETKKGELESARKRVAPKDVPHFNALESQRFYSTNERGEPSCIKFVLESECQLSEPAIFRMGYEALCERIRRAPNKMTSKMHEDLFVVTFEGEDHLFGNVLQTYLYNNFYLKDAIMYCGYYVTHPLEPSVVLKIRGPSNVCSENFIRECTENLARDIETVGEKIYNHILNMSIFEAIPHYNIEIEEDIIYRVGSTLYGDVNDIIQLLTITNKACHIQKKAQTIFDKPDTSKIANAMPTIVPVISTEDIDDTYVRLQNKASTDLAVMNEDLTIDRVERVDRGARVQSFMGWISLPPVLSEPKYDVSSSAIQPDLYYEDLDGMNVGDTVEHMGEHKRVVAKTEHSMDLESSGTVVTVMLDTDHVFKQGSSYYTAMMRRALYVHGVDAKHFFSNFTIHDFVRYALVTKRVRYSDLCKEFPMIFQHARAEMSTWNLGPVRPMLTAPVDVSDVTVPQRSAKGFKHVVKQYTARRETGLVFIEGDDVLVPEQGVMIEAIEADEVFEEDALHGDRELRLEQEMRLIGADLNALPPMIIDNLKALAKTIQKVGEAKIRLYIRAATIIIAQYQYPIVVIRNVDPTTLLEFPEKTTIAKLFSPPSVPAPLAAAYKVISSQPTIATYTNNLANKRSRILANMKKAEVVAPSVDQKDLVTEVLRSTIKTASAQAKCPLGKKAKAPSTFEWIKNKMSPNSASNVVASSKFEVIRALKETKYSINFNTFLYSMYRLINTIVSRWANRHRYDEESEESTLFRSVGVGAGADFDVNIDAFEPDGSPQEKFIILFEMDTALTKVASMNERVATYITSTISARFARYSMTFDMIRDNYEQIRENDKRKKISRWENIDPDAKAYYKQANKMGLISYDDLPGDSGTGENEFIQNVLANQNPDYDPQNADADE